MTFTSPSRSLPGAADCLRSRASRGIRSGCRLSTVSLSASSQTRMAGTILRLALATRALGTPSWSCTTSTFCQLTGPGLLHPGSGHEVRNVAGVPGLHPRPEGQWRAPRYPFPLRSSHPSTTPPHTAASRHRDPYPLAVRRHRLRCGLDFEALLRVRIPRHCLLLPARPCPDRPWALHPFEVVTKTRRAPG